MQTSRVDLGVVNEEQDEETGEALVIDDNNDYTLDKYLIMLNLEAF